MRKKIMVLALAVVSVTLFVIPVTSSAAELHLDNVTTFTGTSGNTLIAVPNLPTYTCEKTHY